MTVRVLVLIEVAEEYADPDHELGITEEANEKLDELLALGDLIDGPKLTTRERL